MSKKKPSIFPRLCYLCGKHRKLYETEGVDYLQCKECIENKNFDLDLGFRDTYGRREYGN